MTSNNLKIVAILAMLIDHIGAILFGGTTYEIYFRIIGRIAFPIFCFLIVEGFIHTSNVKRYLIRLGMFAILSEVAFDLAFIDMSSIESAFYRQNVFFTLFTGLFTLHLMRTISLKYGNRFTLQNILNILVVIGASLFVALLGSDYYQIGVIMILAFYLFRNKPVILGIIILVCNFDPMNLYQLFAVFSMLFLWYYKGEKGKSMNRYLFYAFYPVHLLILVGIRNFLM